MKLSYKAISKEGKVVAGIIDANSVSEAAAYLKGKEYTPISINEASKNKLLGFFPVLNKKVRSSDVILFTRQLSSMISSGLTLIKSLEILKDQLDNVAMVEVVENLISDVEEGSSFSSAIAKHPKVFSPIYSSLIKASEASGLLDKSLLRLSDNLEKQQKLKRTIKSALMYPAIVVALMIVVVIIMLLFVIPQLSVFYQNLNIPLPLPTQIVVSISNLVITFWPIIVGVGLLIAFFYRRWQKTEKGRIIIDSLLLKLPIFGKLIRQAILAEFSRTLGLLVGSGTLVVESMVQTSDITGNVHFKNAIVDVSKRVEKGVSIGDALSTYSLFPPLLVQLVKIGEQTGKLDETLLKASEYFEGEVDQTVKTLTTAMEPFIMIVLGIGVAFLIISVVTPIYSLTSSIQ